MKTYGPFFSIPRNRWSAAQAGYLEEAPAAASPRVRAIAAFGFHPRVSSGTTTNAPRAFVMLRPVYR